MFGGLPDYTSFAGFGRVPYGTLNLTDASPAQSWDEPISFEEVKAHLVLGDIDANQQVLIEDVFIPAARGQAEILQGRDLVQKQWDLSLDYWPAQNAIELRAPLVSVELVQYRDSNGAIHPLVENTDYIVDAAKRPGVIMPPYAHIWPTFTPWASSAILVRFTAGLSASSPFWADAGGRVKIGMALLVAAWFENRLPFTLGTHPIQEYPYTVTACLSAGAVPRAK
jgi:uncharacterized phiE125 gp8 family phage protein